MRASDGSRFRAGLASAFATYRTSSYQGEYQGLFASLSFAHPWLFVNVTLPGYRLLRNGERELGIGDVALDVRGAVFRSDDDSLSVGLELSTTLPSGDMMRGLGMGHTMLMPGVFLKLGEGALSLIAQVAYGQALATGHEQHRGTGPVVNPMNMSEVEHALGLSYAFARHLAALARIYGAVPVAAQGGAAREAAALGLQGIWGPVDVSLEQHLPVVGTPFTAKTVLGLGGQW